MDDKELGFILKEGEGQFIEFKVSFDSKNLAKEIVAFANSLGGKIFLGIDDSKSVLGINTTNQLKSQIQDIARKCDPPVSINIDEAMNDQKNILIITIITEPYMF